MPELVIGRYAVHREIARGGMATIHLARLLGDVGFSRIVAVKRLRPELSDDPDFVAMLLDEARIASKLSHRNVVPVLDVVTAGGEIVLVQEYVHGAPLHWLLGKARELGQYVPADIAVSIACQILAGLHAAHEMVDELGAPLHVVHRDVSPQNVMIATDGTARLLDFGIAKAASASHITRPGTYEGKLAYSAPEQLRGYACKQSDIFSLSVVLWEVIVGHRMHADQSDTEVVSTVLAGNWPTICEALALGCDTAMISEEAWERWHGVDEVVQKGLAVDVADRWQSAADMETALCDVVTPASPRAVARWLEGIGKTFLEKQDRLLAAEETSWRARPPRAMGTLSDGLEPVAAVPETIVHPPSRPVSIPPVPRSLWSVVLIAALAGGLGVALAVVSLRPTAPSGSPEGGAAGSSLVVPRVLPAPAVEPSGAPPDPQTIDRLPTDLLLPTSRRRSTPSPRPRR